MEQSLAGQIAEIWVLYIIGMVMIGARIFVRTKLVGYQNYEWDDYLIFGVAVSAGLLSLGGLLNLLTF